MKRGFYIPIILFLVFFSLLSLSSGVSAKDGPREQTFPWSVSLGGIHTDAQTMAVNLLIDYSKNLSEVLMTNPPNISSSSGWLLNISPVIKIETGANDAFNGIILKLSGNYIRFFLTKIAGVKTPDLDRLFYAVPISLGSETDSGFNNVCALLEIGYVPFYLKNANTNLKLGLNPNVGLFLQAGYKLKGTGQEESGGAADESKESPNSALFRLKANCDADFSLIPYNDGKFGLSILPKVTGWYDIANATFYYSLELIARLNISKNIYYDFFKFQKGSGEPNFNQGDQFGTNITIKF